MITRTSAVRRTLEDRVLELTLARPEKKNALTEAMYRELADALTAASADEEVSAVIFAAEGGVFSAGNDLADFHAIGSSEEAQQPEDNAALGWSIRSLTMSAARLRSWSGSSPRARSSCSRR